MEVDKIMRTLLTLGANSSTPRRHGSGQNIGNITNTRGKLEHSTKTWKWTSSLPLVLVMFSLFCPLPCLRGVFEFAPSVSNVLVDKIMRTLLTLGANSSTPRRHGSGQNIGNITNTRGRLEHSTKTWKWTSHYFVHFHVFVGCSSLHLVLVMYSLFCPLPCLRGVFEFAPSVSNGPIILSSTP
jgi:hypothetical protein